MGCYSRVGLGDPGRNWGRSGEEAGGRGAGLAPQVVFVCVCDFGFDLLGDELIPLYNRLGADRENGCGAICVAMGTIAGRARAWKNTAFVGGGVTLCEGTSQGQQGWGSPRLGPGVALPWGLPTPPCACLWVSFLAYSIPWHMPMHHATVFPFWLPRAPHSCHAHHPVLELVRKGSN